MTDTRRVRIEHDKFQVRELAVRKGTFFREPVLLLDGERVRKREGRYVVLDDCDFERQVDFWASPFDPVPGVAVDGKRVVIAPPLRWFEVALAVTPMLVAVLGLAMRGVMGGALGGVVGLIASYANFVALRRDGSHAGRYATIAMVTIAAVFAWLSLQLVVDGLFRERFGT